jgi:protein phosphatase 1 regulatory subunit 11
VTVCCIYHKPRRYDESSSEDDSSDSDSDSSCGHGHAHNHRHQRSQSGDNSNQASKDAESTIIHELEEEDSDKNAYEVAPVKKGKRKAKGELFILTCSRYLTNDAV